jgi:hypothetical protein
MKNLAFTLIADGSSDKILLRIIKWSLDDLYADLPNEGAYADFRGIKNPPKNLKEKARLARMNYPFDILFVHRDAEKTDIKMVEQRAAEIKKELEPELLGQTVCVIPVKMMETWLLIEAEAIKRAAGNRNYKGEINLPALNRLENESQPKTLLHQLLKDVSGLKGRNMKKFNPEAAVHLIAEYIEDFSPLRTLEAFVAFETELKIAVDNYLKN